jgi:uncharacterized protein YkwD
MKSPFRLIMAALIGSLLAFHAADAGSAGQDLSGEVLAEINLARTDPRTYAGYLRDFRVHYRGTSYRLPGKREFVVTSEGVSAVDEAISALSRQKPVPSLAWSPGLAAAAAELVREEGLTGATGHRGMRSGGPRERINRQGEWRGWIGENISYGPDGARLVVMQLIIDDGVPGRGHRKNIFSSYPRVAGVACGPHPTFRTMCVTDFAQGFREN